MTYCIAVFKSRSEAISCKGTLTRAGIRAELISTPSSLHLGCGLSVKFPVSGYNKARAIIARCNYGAFYGYINI